MVQQARRLEPRLSGNRAISDGDDDQFWSWSLRLLFLLVAAAVCWAIPLALIDLLAF